MSFLKSVTYNEIGLMIQTFLFKNSFNFVGIVLLIRISVNLWLMTFIKNTTNWKDFNKNIQLSLGSFHQDLKNPNIDVFHFIFNVHEGWKKEHWPFPIDHLLLVYSPKTNLTLYRNKTHHSKRHFSSWFIKRINWFCQKIKN